MENLKVGGGPIDAQNADNRSKA